VNKWVARVSIVVAFVLGVGWEVVKAEPWFWGSDVVCDANFPRWMLEAQPDGGGCYDRLPAFMAPPGADWTIYCTMWCEPSWPPPGGE
jgi:hypothetical protein